jgi:hypothetical protein
VVSKNPARKNRRRTSFPQYLPTHKKRKTFGNLFFFNDGPGTSEGVAEAAAENRDYDSPAA